MFERQTAHDTYDAVLSANATRTFLTFRAKPGARADVFMLQGSFTQSARREVAVAAFTPSLVSVPTSQQHPHYKTFNQPWSRFKGHKITELYWTQITRSEKPARMDTTTRCLIISAMETL
jgi:hypothetical protein